MVALLFPGSQALAKDALQELLLHAVRLIEWEPIALVVSLLPVDGAIDENQLLVDEHEKNSNM
jgi:hypothetical protein